MTMSGSPVIPIVSTTNAASLAVPSGTKLSTSRCSASIRRGTCNPEGPSKEQYPILLHAGSRYWPLSYDDDRFAFAIVRTSDGLTEPIDVSEIKGARYIDSIAVFAGNESVSFIGQDDRSVLLPWRYLSASSTLITDPSKTPILSPSDIEDELDAGTIVGIAIGCVFGVMITVVGGYLWRRWMMKRRKVTIGPYENGDVEAVSSEGRAEVGGRDQAPINRGRAVSTGSVAVTIGSEQTVFSSPEGCSGSSEEPTERTRLLTPGPIIRIPLPKKLGDHTVGVGFGTPPER